MRKKIGELLIESGAVTEAQVRQALGQQQAAGNGQRLGAVLVHLGHASSTAVSRALARQMDLPFMELPEIPPEVRESISLDIQERHRLVPFRLEKEGRGERLYVAVEDPSALSKVDEPRAQLNKPIQVVMAAPDDIARAINQARGDDDLEIVETISLDDDVEVEIQPATASEAGAGRRDPAPVKPPPPPVAAVLLEWDLPPPLEGAQDLAPPPPRAVPVHPVVPPAPPGDLDDEDRGDVTLITPLSSLKSKPGAAPVRPPPPPPMQESEEVPAEFVSEPGPEPGSTGAGKPRVPVVVFGGAAQGLPQPPPSPEPPEITEADLKVLEDIERLSLGQEALQDSEKVKPARMVASLIRLLMRKRVIREEEFLEELSRK
jgi:hypothetical protein